jgi:hypothetical protein
MTILSDIQPENGAPTNGGDGLHEWERGKGRNEMGRTRVAQAKRKEAEPNESFVFDTITFSLKRVNEKVDIFVKQYRQSCMAAEGTKLEIWEKTINV